LTYRSEVKLKFKDSADSKGILPPLSRLTSKKIDLKLTIPHGAMFSVYHQLTDKFALTANLGWQEQSEFGKQEITIKDVDIIKLTSDLDYDDT